MWGLFEPWGLRPSEAVPGALGLVAAPGPFGSALALCIHPGGWAVKDETGLNVVSEYKKAWACP